MSYDISSSWRGVVGVVWPTYRVGQIEELIRLLPEGMGVIPVYLGVQTGAFKEFQEMVRPMEEKIGELAKLKVDLIHPAGSPFFALRGYKGEEEHVRDLEKQHRIPILTSITAQVEAVRALGIKRLLIICYVTVEELVKVWVQYFTDAGFEVLGFESISVPFAEVGSISPHEVYAFTKKHFLKHKNVEGILLLGSGWRILDIIQVLEQDLQVPVAHAITARVWAIQKRLYVRQPLKGYGRLLEEMP